MSQIDQSLPGAPGAGGTGPGRAGRPVYRTGGVLALRSFAWFLDLFFILMFMLALYALVLVLGVVTFGLAWFLLVLIAPLSGILYSVVTVGGSKQATIGMRIMGLRVVRTDGAGRVDGVVAGVHALLFYVAASTVLLWCVDVLFGLFNADSRMVHDQLVGLTVVRSD